jgi:hypothetical protein
MVTLLIIALAIFAVIGTGLYLWQKSAGNNPEYTLPPPPDARGLFGDDASIAEQEAQRLAIDAATQAESLLARAKDGDRDALKDAHANGDRGLYDRVLSELVESAQSDPKLLALMSYVSQNELPVNVKLAQAVIAAWQQTPDRNLTAKALHFAALSDDAGAYQETVETALQLWGAGKLADISAVELRALFDGEFWVLSSRSRSSGAGFVLKRTLASARRELEAAIVRSLRVNKGDQSKEGPP